MLTEEQIYFFKTFGYLHLKGVFSEMEIQELTEVSDGILAYDREDRPFDDRRRQYVCCPFENNPALTLMLEDDRIFTPIEQLLGENFISLGSEANLYVGDTGWHPDWHRHYPKIKVALYLEPLRRESGCLRVVPGSHHREFHEPLLANQFELPKIDVPYIALESDPGDVVMFNMRVFHSSSGGRSGRRMLAMNFSANPVTAEDEEAYKENIRAVIHELVKQRFYKESNRLFEDSYLHSDKPRLKALSAKLFEYNLLSS